MKKLLLFALLLLSANTFAQLLTFGPQVTINTTSVRTEGFSSDKSGAGMNYGGFVRVGVAMFYGQGELSYSQSKFSISRDGTSETEYKLSGTDLTLLAGFKLVPLGKLGNVRVFAGYDWKNFSTDTNNNLNHFDTEANNNSFVIGAGVDLWKFTLDYRFLNGLTDIDRSGGEVKMNQSCFVIGFKF